MVYFGVSPHETASSVLSPAPPTPAHSLAQSRGSVNFGAEQIACAREMDIDGPKVSMQEDPPGSCLVWCLRGQLGDLPEVVERGSRRLRPPFACLGDGADDDTFPLCLTEAFCKLQRAEHVQGFYYNYQNGEGTGKWQDSLKVSAEKDLST